MPKKREDFEEIAHCGGKFTVTVETGPKGERLVSFGVSNSQPVPASICGIYALPQGVPLGMIEMGGIGQPFNPAPHPDCYTIFMASDARGFFGHECPACKGYWRSGAAIAGWETTCPYCGLRDGAHRFLTPGQRQFIETLCEVTEHAIRSGKDGEFGLDMDKVADAIKEEVEPPPFYYVETTQQNFYRCEACNQRDDILGRFGYCSTCGTRNDLQELTATIEQIRTRTRERLAAGEPVDPAVPDSVSAFDSMAKQYAKQLAARVPMTPGRRTVLETTMFHNPKARAEELRAWFGIDLLDGLDATDQALIRRMFLRRHVHEHNGGVVDQEYLDESGDTSVRLGQALREHSEEVFKLLGLIVKMARNLHRDFHVLFPPVAEPIRHETERKARLDEYRANP
jgi:hypothetical protein